MLRREFLAASIAAAPVLAAKKWDMKRIAFITDEAAATPADAIAFAKKYSLKCVELREVPGVKKSYASLSEEELKAAARELKDAGLRVSFFNSGGTKYPLPGTDKFLAGAPEKQADWQRQYDGRMDNLRRSIRAAHIFDVDKARVFAFGRVQEPERLFPRIADELGTMGDIARKEGIRLLLENEGSCNVGTCVEMAGLIKMLPESTFGLNWDANNGQTSKEIPFPNGYSILPKHRIYNVHMHGRTLLDPEKKLHWAAIFDALIRDGYKGCAGLETHYFDGTKIEKSHLCMQELERITAARS
jgi:L-ribulose-5-phosphate 3-epimerase